MYESRSEMTGTMFDSVHVMVYSSNPERTSPPAGYVTRTSAATTPKNMRVRTQSIMIHNFLIGTHSTFCQVAVRYPKLSNN